MSLLRKRRGVSGIISGVFLVAVAVMVFNVLAWQFFQYDAYHRIALERDQQEWERSNERLAVTSVETGTTVLNFTVKNYGSVTAHIVDLFVTFTNGTHLMYSLDVWIGPGTVRRIIGPSQLKLQLGDVYDFQIGTARGNLVAPVGATITNQQQPGGNQLMPFIFSFSPEDFQYARSIGGPWSNAWVFTITGNNDLFFRLRITNTAGGDVQIETRSHLNFMTVGDQNNMRSKANTGLTNTVSITKDSEAWLYFNPIARSNFASQTTYYYVLVAIFWHYTNPIGPTLGTNMAILAVEIG